MSRRRHFCTVGPDGRENVAPAVGPGEVQGADLVANRYPGLTAGATLCRASDANSFTTSVAAILLTLVLVPWLCTAQVLAQQTRTEQIEQQQSAKAANLQPPEREAGDQIITRFEKLFNPEPPGLRPTLGDFRQDAGFAGGVAAVIPFGETGLWTTQAAWSIHNFKQVESTLQLPPAASGRLNFATTVEWNDAPELHWYGLDNDASRKNRSSYGLRWIEAGAQADARAFRRLHFGAGVGYLDTESRGTRGPVFDNQSVPGSGASPSWIHARASVAVDTRESAGYTRRGGLYAVTYHRYRDPDGKFSFDRNDIDVRQFVPLLHDNWVIALQGRAQLTNTPSGQIIPFFMLPYLGGREGLRGFDPYRFTDKDTLLLRGELRWTAAPVVDMAVFTGEGKVAGKVRDLDLHHLHREVGMGIRFHGPAFTALRFEVAHSIEGWHFTAAHSISF